MWATFFVWKENPIDFKIEISKYTGIYLRKMKNQKNFLTRNISNFMKHSRILPHLLRGTRSLFGMLLPSSEQFGFAFIITLWVSFLQNKILIHWQNVNHLEFLRKFKNFNIFEWLCVLPVIWQKIFVIIFYCSCFQI